MENLSEVTKAMFYKRGWDKISDEGKENNFFIINRYFSKKYPEYAYLVNLKTNNKVVALNLWNAFQKTKPYPAWFWSKSIKTNKSEYKSDEIIELQKTLQVNKKDIYYLIKNFPELIKEELKLINKRKKQK